MSRLTGKQTAFIHAYLGEARFNATAAAKIAGYKATSKHSFESIGSENLLRPAIRAVIDEHWKMSRMTAEECLGELTKLARGSGKDQIRALALLSQHHGLLDGRFEKLNGASEIVLKAEFDKGWDACVEELNKDIERYNAEAVETNKRKDAQWEALKIEYKDFPEAVEALTRLRLLMEGKQEIELPPEPQTEVEIIPPERRLQPAAVERMMRTFEPEIVEPEPQEQPATCRHGYPPGECNVIEVGYDCPHYYNRNESKYRYAET